MTESAKSEARRDNRSYYDEFSAWYESERHEGYHAMLDDLEVDLLSRYVRGKEVLEVGCGTGLLLGRVAEMAASARGVDISAGMLSQAQARGLSVVQAEASALPFASASFDVVYSFKVLAHVEDIRGALRELARVTRPGGTLLLEFYNPMSLRYMAKRAGGPGKISASTDEAAVFTRWDSPWTVRQRLPPELEWIAWAGVRVVTPAAMVHKLPVVAKIVRRMEFVARDSPLAVLGGFLIAIVQRRGSEAQL